MRDGLEGTVVHRDGAYQSDDHRGRYALAKRAFPPALFTSPVFYVRLRDLIEPSGKPSRGKYSISPWGKYSISPFLRQEIQNTLPHKDRGEFCPKIYIIQLKTPFSKKPLFFLLEGKNA